MNNRFSRNVTACNSVIPKRGQLLYKPYQPCLTLTDSSINGIDRNDSSTVKTKNHARLGPKLIEIVKNKLSYGAKILPLGREGRIFTKVFNTRDCEKLLHVSLCYIYTTAGPIAGTLFISNERVGFCSNRSLKTYSTTLEMLKFQYKVSIPLGKIKGVREGMNVNKPSNKYMEFVTVDDFSFWFLGFPNYKKTLRYLRQTIDRDSLSR